MRKSMEVNSSSAICKRCGTAYGRLKGYFSVSYGALYKGTGYLPYCRECVDNMYNRYLSEIKDPKLAVRQMCRKMDLYWNDNIYESVEKKNVSRSMMVGYIGKINTQKYAGKSYDDTLRETNTLWEFSESLKVEQPDIITENEEAYDISDEVKEFWGSGYTLSMYNDLEQRRKFWISKFPDGYEFDIGTEAIIRQICALELDINRDRAAGKPIDKNINALNTLLGSACLKPAQQKSDASANGLDATPLGVWLYKYENLRPLPEIDEDLKDVNGIKKYVFTWMGHLCKMLNIKNTYTKMYEEEIERLRVERPEYNDEDDESLLINSYSSEYDDE